jgi:hypothetical protein
MNNKAPIVLFTFNRPEHTRSTLEALTKNPELSASQLFIYCDGARNDAEVAQVEETRQLVRDWSHPEKTVTERDQNWGLANSIIDGVTHLCETYGRVIVLEDDMVVSEHFLSYMNSALEKYQADDRVISIHGYSFPIDGLPEAYFIKGASCWGWATWKRGWDLFQPDGKKLLDKLLQRKLMHRFNILGAYPYRRMLSDQIHGRIDSWAVRWYASALIHDKLTLYPGRSLVYNTGLDGSGSHCDVYDGFATNLSTTAIDLDDLPVSEDERALEAWRRYLKSVRKEKLLSGILSLGKMRKFISQRLK